MIIKKAIVGLIIFTSCYSCNNSDDIKKDTTPIHMPSTTIDEERILKIKVIDGDTLSYLKLRKLYVLNDNTPDFLTWAMLMSNKYNYETAHYDVFFCLQSLNVYYGEYSEVKKSHINNLDSLTNNIAKSYLLKMSNKNMINETLEAYYKDTLR